MRGGRKTVLAGQSVLQRLNVRVHDFNVFAATFADEVIVMGAAGVFVPGDAVAKAQFARKARAAQQLHCPVYSGLPEGGIFVPNQIVEILNGQMPFLLKENLNNSITLRRISQTFATQERAKGGIGIGWKGGRIAHEDGPRSRSEMERE